MANHDSIDDTARQDRGARPTPAVVHVISGLGNGGAEGALFRLVTHDDTHRHIVVSLGDGGKYGPMLRAAGIEVHEITLGAGGRRGALLRLLRLVATIRRARPDVVQCWLYHGDVIGGIAARIAGVRRVFWSIRGAEIDPTRAKASTVRMLRVATRLSRIVPTGIVSCSAVAAEAHVVLGYPADRITVVPNGYDLEEMRPDPSGRARVRAEIGAGPDDFVVGMAARFDPQKDHGTLLRGFSAMCRRHRSILVLAGAGCDAGNPELTALVHRHGIRDRVRLLGQRTDMPAFYSALDVHVLSSAYGEGFPNAVAEAMACGTPVIATDVGEAKAVLGENGVLAPPRGVSVISSALAELALAHRDGACTLVPHGARTRDHITRNFSLGVMTEGFAHAWRLK